MQEIIQHLNQIHQLSQPLVHDSIKGILTKYCDSINDSVIKAVVNTVSENNVLLKFCGTNGPLSTSKRRALCVLRKFPLVMSVEYVVDKGKKSVVFVPVQSMLQKLLNKQDVLDNVLSTQTNSQYEYQSYKDGSNFKGNDFFKTDELRIALGLYIDDFEVSNPLGTSKKKHKMCAVYWVIANLP